MKFGRRSPLLAPTSLALICTACQAPPGAAPGPVSPEAPRGALPQPARGTVVTEPSLECWYLFHAKNGDVWFGSEERGVFRYDGTQLVNYTTADGLGGNQIRGIQGDKAGNVYFTTSGGVCKFDGQVFTTLRAVDPPQSEKGGAEGGWRLHPDDLWFAWGKGVCRYDGSTLYDLRLPKSELQAAFDEAVPNAPYDPYAAFSFYRDRRGHLWIGTSNFGACRYDGASFGWLYEEHLVFAPNGGLFGLRSMLEDEDGAYWICNTQYRYHIAPENRDGRVVYTREAGIDPRLTGGEVVYFQGAVRDAAGDLWLAPYGGGIWRYDGERAVNYPVQADGADIQVFSIFADNRGGHWLGTPTAGPYRFDGERFEPFRP